MLSPPGHSFSSRHTFHCHDSFKPYVRRPCLCISAQSLPRSGSLCRVSASGPQCEPTARLPLLLAGSILCNTLAAPLLLPAPAENALPLPEATAVAVPSSKPAQYYVADAPIVQADPEVIEQQQWWQQDQQVWLELTSATELTAFLSSNQPPPAWPALDNSTLNPKLRLVEFYATWCPACKAAAPGMAEVAGDPELRQHCSFARVNVDRVKPLVRQLGITKIPTVLLLGPDGTTLDSFRASGQVARDALQQQLAAMQQQQLTLQPSLPSLPPGAAGLEEQPAPSEVDGNGSNGPTDNGPVNGDNTGTTDGGSSSSSSSSGAACGVVPEPSCGSLPPGIGPGDGYASTSNSRPAGELPPAASESVGAPATPAATTPNRPAAVNTSPEDKALQAAKQAFLQQYGSEYGYNGWLEQHYQQEIGYRLTANKHYLDYTGAALYPASLLEAVYKDLLTHTYGNPHSAGAASPSSPSTSNAAAAAAAAGAVAAPPAAASEAVMEAAAAAVLDHLHADPADYQVVFTRSATDALRMVGEMFPWQGSTNSDGGRIDRLQTGGPSELEVLTLTTPSQQQQTSAAQPAPAAAEVTTTSSSSSSNSRGSAFIYTRSNHNSVLGIGAYAAAAGAELVPQSDEGMEAWVAGLEQQQQRQQQDAVGQGANGDSATTYSLLAYPAEDNFAGVIYPLDWINRVHAAGGPHDRTLVLLDAAAYLPTHDLNLSRHPADFVVASFYKMFGYPTGLGVLVLRTEHVPQLNKVYFGGGSVALATPEGCWHMSKCDPAAALSDGTPNYLGAAALKLAYDSWDSRGGMQAVAQHTQALSSWLTGQLTSLHHSNGAPLIQLYGRHSEQQQATGFSQGAIFNFQVLQQDGQPVSFSRIDQEATAAGLFLRSGCVCNPGACYDSLGLDAAEVQALAGLKEGCGDEMDFVTVMRPQPEGQHSSAGKGWFWGSDWQQQQNEEVTPLKGDLVETEVPLGSVRASLGWASTFADAYALVQFLRAYLT